MYVLAGESLESCSSIGDSQFLGPAVVFVRRNVIYEEHLMGFLTGNHLYNSCRQRSAKYHVQVLPFPCQPVTWSGMLVGNCQPLLMYVLRQHTVLVPPAFSQPPACSCFRSSASQTPLLHSFLNIQTTEFPLPGCLIGSSLFPGHPAR